MLGERRRLPAAAGTATGAGVKAEASGSPRLRHSPPDPRRDDKYATSKICKTRTLPPLPLPDLDETEEMEVTGENGQKESPL